MTEPTGPPTADRVLRADPSLTPAMLATIQAAHAAAFASHQESAAPTQKAPDIAGQLASGTQQLEARRMA